LHFIWSIAWDAIAAPYADLGTNPLGWIVGVGIPFGVLAIKARRAPKGEKWSLILSAWRAELRDTLLVYLLVLVAVIAYEGFYRIPHRIWSEASSVPPPMSQFLSPPDPPIIGEKPTTETIRSDRTRTPIVKIDIYNNGMARITNEGAVPIRDIQADFSSQLMDMANPPRGQEESAVPAVKSSSFMSGPVSIFSGILNSEKTTQTDLTRIAQFNVLPDTPETNKAMSGERFDEIRRTFYVFRFTFRDAVTGQKFGCFKIHGSFLKYPSEVDDNVSFYGSPAIMRFYNRIAEAAFGVAADHYKDRAMGAKCEN